MQMPSLRTGILSPRVEHPRWLCLGGLVIAAVCACGRIGFDGTDNPNGADNPNGGGNADGGGNNAYDAMPYGSLVWAKERNWTSGPSNYITFRTTIVGYNYDAGKDATCRYDRAHPTAFQWRFNNEASAQKWFDYVPAKCWGSNLGYVDSIGIHFKLECGLGEYVAVVSENARICFGNYYFHGALCAAYSGAASTACNARTFDTGDSRGAWVNAAFTSGDWDFGVLKGKCTFNEYVAGVSTPSVDSPAALDPMLRALAAPSRSLTRGKPA